MVILASNNVISGDKIDLLHFSNETWFVISKDDKNPQNIEDLEYSGVSEDYLYSRIPKLKGILDQKEETTINIDYDTGDVRINEKHTHFGIPTHDAKASHQVNAKFSFIKWIRTNQARYQRLLYVVIIGILLAKTLSWWFSIPVILYIAFEIFVTLKDRDMFYSGMLCPAVIVDADLSLIAVLTDLSLGFGSFPIIKIKKVNLPDMDAKNNMRLAIAGGFSKSEESYQFWNYFDPLPIISGVSDIKIHDNKVNEISTSDWTKLKLEVKKLSNPYTEGYYPIEIESSSWKDMDLESIDWVNS